MFEKKIEKNTIPCRISREIDPAKRGIKRLNIELAMLNFRPRIERALPAHRDRWDWSCLPFWERRDTWGSPQDPVPFPSCLGTTQVRVWLPSPQGWGLGPTHPGGPQTRGEGDWILG